MADLQPTIFHVQRKLRKRKAANEHEVASVGIGYRVQITTKKAEVFSGSALINSIEDLFSDSSAAQLVRRRRFFPHPLGFIQQIALVVLQITLERFYAAF